MTIVVLGAGAIGSLYAAKLSARHDVTVLARGPHVDAINRDGLRIVGQEEMTCRVRAVTTIAALPDARLFLLTTKVNANDEIARELASLGHGAMTIVCVQNGLGGEEVVRRRLGDRAVVFRAVTQFGAIFREPGLVEYMVRGFTMLERGPGSGEIAALLSACGLDARLSDDIRIDVWRKLIFNCVINPITSILQSEVGAIADRRLDPLKRLVVDECLRVAAADGVTFEVDFMKALIEVFGPSRNIASMRQDLLHGRPTEIDFMNGAVADLGRRFGIACPVNAALVAIIKAMERAPAGEIPATRGACPPCRGAGAAWKYNRE